MVSSQIVAETDEMEGDVSNLRCCVCVSAVLVLNGNRGQVDWLVVDLDDLMMSVVSDVASTNQFDVEADSVQMLLVTEEALTVDWD